MSNPQTVNAGIIVPLTGADVDLWGQNDVNPNMVAIDGLFCGVQVLNVTGGNKTLSAPALFTATPSPGPTESQNRVLRFTGALVANEIVTLPIPGVYVVENLTTGNFQVQLQGAVAVTEAVCVPQGYVSTIYNDGSRVRFVSLGKVGEMELWAGLTTMPSWVNACTVPPYLLCDGTIYNFSQFPYLGARLQGAFGGNGVTTFGVPDLRGRVPLAPDGTGARISVGGGAGFNGQTIGAGGGAQGSQLITDNLPPYRPSGRVATTQSNPGAAALQFPPQNPSTVGLGGATSGGSFSQPPTFNSTFTGDDQGGTSVIFSNVQPSIVTGIWAIKT